MGGTGPIPLPRTVYAGSGGAIYRSTDNGVHWNLLISRTISIHSIAHTPRGTLAAGCDYSFLRVSYNGSTWAEFQLGSGGSPKFIVVNSTGYLLASWYGVWSSEYDGASWQHASNGLPEAIGRTVCFDSDDYAYVSGGSLIYRSAAPAVVTHH